MEKDLKKISEGSKKDCVNDFVLNVLVNAGKNTTKINKMKIQKMQQLTNK